MNYAAIKNCDIADGPGVRVSLFVSGCTNHCEGCFQPETWDFAYGSPFTPEVEQKILTLLSPSYIRGLTILGGEPMEPANQPAVAELLRNVHARFPEKNIWLFTGFTYELLTSPRAYPHVPGTTQEILALLDVLVDGPFIQSQKDLMLRFRGSRNQRLLDMHKTREAGTPVPWTD